MKIDTSKIPNFDSLPEEARNAILGTEFSDPVDMAQFVAKATFDKKASEAADLAKQLKAKMTDDEAKEAERAENERKIMEELETLRQSYAEQAPRLIPLRDELLKLSQVQHNVELLLCEREERHLSEISR